MNTLPIPIYTHSISTSSNASTITWGGNHTHNTGYPGYPNYGGVMHQGTYTTSTSYAPSLKVDIKRCRSCNHAHIEGNTGCIDYSLDFQNSVVFVPCSCKEYLPKDNLEYLEYLDKKKENK